MFNHYNQPARIRNVFIAACVKLLLPEKLNVSRVVCVFAANYKVSLSFYQVLAKYINKENQQAEMIMI